MQTGRADLDAMAKVSSIGQTEPTFLIRPQDAVGAAAVRSWVEHARKAGVPTAVLEQALQQADRLDAWPNKKLAGDDHLAEATRKQLENEFRRRLAALGPFSTRLVPIEPDEASPFAAPLLRQLAREQTEAARLFELTADATARDLGQLRKEGVLTAGRDQQIAAARANAGYHAAVAEALERGAQAIDQITELGARAIEQVETAAHG